MSRDAAQAAGPHSKKHPLPTPWAVPRVPAPTVSLIRGHCWGWEVIPRRGHRVGPPEALV